MTLQVAVEIRHRSRLRGWDKHLRGRNLGRRTTYHTGKITRRLAQKVLLQHGDRFWIWRVDEQKMVLLVSLWGFEMLRSGHQCSGPGRRKDSCYMSQPVVKVAGEAD